MKAGALPPDETERLAALRQFEILDSESEKAFDDLAVLAAHVCGTPMALISLVDEHRQWFKARVGLEVKETPRDIAFCAHAIGESDVMVVEDAQTDDRFADNPLVSGEPHIRFYAGAPLITEEGHAIGTLCTLDRRPRKLTAEQVHALSVLARAVVTQLELRRTMRLLERLLQKERLTQEQSFRLLEAIPVGLFVADTNGRPHYANRVAEEILGRGASEVAGVDELAETFEVRVAGTKETYPAHRMPLVRSLNGETSHVDDMVIVSEGRERFLEVWGAPIRDASGTVQFGIASFIDISARRRSEKQLAESEQRYRLLFERNLAGVFVNTVSGRMIDVNEAFASMFGYSRQEVLKLHARDFYVDEQARREYLERMEASGSVSNLEVRRKRRDGSLFWGLINASILESEIDGERIVEGTLLDITARKEVEERTSYLAHHDALTGLPNRTLLGDRLEEAIAQAARLEHLVAICFIDLDRFKPVNDELGHPAGDWLLKEVAQRLKQLVRTNDTIARVGGDEFVIVLTALHDTGEGETLAGKVVEVLCEPFRYNGIELRIGASAGVAFYPTDGDSSTALLASADEAMYRAKASGRNAVVMASRP